MFLKKNPYSKNIERNSLLFVFFASVILSLLPILKGDLINNDGILYINTAKEFLSNGNTTKYYWPFYSILIAVTSKITLLSLLNTAYLLNIILQAVFCVFFVRIVYLLDIKNSLNKRKNVIITISFILSLNYFNQFRDLIIRDYGYWAFMIISLYYIIKANKNKKFIDCTLWQLSIFVAFLFRPEAIIFTVIPLLLLIFNKTDVRTLIKQSYFIFWIVLFIFFCTLLSDNNINPKQLNYISISDITNRINTKTLHLLKSFFPDYYVGHNFITEGDARVFWVSGIISIHLWKVVYNLFLIGTPFVVLLFFIIRKANLIILCTNKEILLFLMIALLLPIPVMFFISSSVPRYLFLAISILGLITVRMLIKLIKEIDRSKNKYKNIILLMIFIFLGGNFIDSIYSTSSQKYFHDAKKYLLSIEGKTACSDQKIEFYTNGKCKYKPLYPYNYKVLNKIIKKDKYDYLLISLGRNWQERISTYEKDTRLKIIKYFSSPRDDRIYLFKIKK